MALLYWGGVLGAAAAAEAPNFASRWQWNWNSKQGCRMHTHQQGHVTCLAKGQHACSDTRFCDTSGLLHCKGNLIGTVLQSNLNQHHSSTEHQCKALSPKRQPERARLYAGLEPSATLLPATR